MQPDLNYSIATDIKFATDYACPLIRGSCSIQLTQEMPNGGNRRLPYISGVLCATTGRQVCRVIGFVIHPKLTIKGRRKLRLLLETDGRETIKIDD